MTLQTIIYFIRNFRFLSSVLIIEILKILNQILKTCVRLLKAADGKVLEINCHINVVWMFAFAYYKRERNSDNNSKRNEKIRNSAINHAC